MTIFRPYSLLFTAHYTSFQATGPTRIADYVTNVEAISFHEAVRKGEVFPRSVPEGTEAEIGHDPAVVSDLHKELRTGQPKHSVASSAFRVVWDFVIGALGNSAGTALATNAWQPILDQLNKAAHLFQSRLPLAFPIDLALR
jgi:hypothetical protein